MASFDSHPQHHKISQHTGFTYDDVLLLPRLSDFSRDAVDLSTDLHPKLRLRVPIISSPMDTVTETDMAILMAQHGALGVIHRNLEVAVQADMVKSVKSVKAHEGASVSADGKLMAGAAVGAGSDLEERVDALLSAGADVLVVDSGHGHSKNIIEAVKSIRKSHPDAIIMAGNIATADGAKALIDAGADILRVGVGPGSICTTRIVTGMGVPQLTAVMSAVEGAKGSSVTVVADGGIKQMGDMAKALSAGAHAVMLGSLLAGFDQSPGEVVAVDGTQYKQYRGMGSVTSMRKGSARRYGQSEKTHARKLIPEGVEGLVPCKGDAVDFLHQASGSLRSAFYYVGCKDLLAVHADARFIPITPASMRESHPHSITMVSGGGNYMA